MVLYLIPLTLGKNGGAEMKINVIIETGSDKRFKRVSRKSGVGSLLGYAIVGRLRENHGHQSKTVKSLLEWSEETPSGNDTENRRKHPPFCKRVKSSEFRMMNISQF